MCTGLFYHGNVGQHVAGFNPPCFSSLGYIWMIRSVLRCFKKNLARNILDGLIYQDGQ